VGTRLSYGPGGQSVGVNRHADRTVANPNRTHVDGDPTRRERDGDVHGTRDRHETRNRPSPAVAKENRDAKQAVADADGPLD
jgi:hypothetical protein